MAADTPTPLRKAAISDSSGGFRAPELPYGMRFKDYGSYGLRQYSGWVREEFLQELIGREGARVYREMMDMNSTIGSMMFAIMQAMRKVEWRVDAADDSSESQAMAEFVDSLRDDMSHTWEDFVAEALSMLGYGYSVHELVYKKRCGPRGSLDAIKPAQKYLNGIRQPGSADVDQDLPESKFNDGYVGWRRLPIRGQDTILKWFFDANGQVTGMTQQPWVGQLLDLPIDKMLLFRPTAHKNNPEGRSVLRNAYRSYYFIKRLEELEAILVERMGGFPVVYVPSSVIDSANAANPDPAALKTFQTYKSLVTDTRVNEQMGAMLPSDVYYDQDGKPSNVRMFEFQLVTPQHGRSNMDTDKMIERYGVNILMTLLADFIHMGHEVRGTNNLALTKVDMFYGAIEGWLLGIAAVLNRYALPRLWAMNNFKPDTMPRLVPDMPQRLDLDSLGNFIKNIALSGMPLFPDEELQGWIRDAAGWPEGDEEDDPEVRDGPDAPKSLQQATAEAGAQAAQAIAATKPQPMPGKPSATEKLLTSSDVVNMRPQDISKRLKAAVARRILRQRHGRVVR